METPLDILKKQLASTENELETAKAHVYRCDGAISMLKHLIAELDVKPVSQPPLVE